MQRKLVYQFKHRYVTIELLEILPHSLLGRFDEEMMVFAGALTHYLTFFQFFFLGRRVLRALIIVRLENSRTHHTNSTGRLNPERVIVHNSPCRVEILSSDWLVKIGGKTSTRYREIEHIIRILAVSYRSG